MKKLTTPSMNKDYVRGVRDAVAVASDYDGLSSHTYFPSECIPYKLNVSKKKPRKNPFDKWLDGMALALAEINRKWDQPTMIVEVMQEAGVSVAQLGKARVDPYDLDEIKRCFKKRKTSRK